MVVVMVMVMVVMIMKRMKNLAGAEWRREEEKYFYRLTTDGGMMGKNR